MLSINADASVYDARHRLQRARAKTRLARAGPTPPQTVSHAMASCRRSLKRGLPDARLHDPRRQEVRSRFAMLRVIAAHPVERDGQKPREEWLIIEWPEDAEQPSMY